MSLKMRHAEAGKRQVKREDRTELELLDPQSQRMCEGADFSSLSPGRHRRLQGFKASSMFKKASISFAF